MYTCRLISLYIIHIFKYFLQIPIYRGVNETLIDLTIPLDNFHGSDGFGDLNYTSSPNIDIVKPEPASVIMGQMVLNNPGEISIVSIGPVTNLALAVKLYPTFMENVRSLHVMGGNYRGTYIFIILKGDFKVFKIFV